MADTLATAVDNVIDRLLLLEPLAVTQASYATMRWIEFRQDAPYWVNRIAAIGRPTGPEDLPTYELVIQMRLILSYQSGVTREDDIAGNPQEDSWAYIPQVLRYFERYRDLAPPGEDEDGDPLYPTLTYIDASRVSIVCARGLDLQVLPLTRSIYLSTDFELTVPLQVGNEE